MKKILIATAAFAALAATSAQAQDASWTVNGNVVAQCAINTQLSSVPLGNMVDTDGFLNASNVQSTLTSGFNSAPTEAWCSGANNKVVLSRTALVRADNGTALNGFGEAVLYDLGVELASGTISLNPFNANGDEGTSDGAGNGPTTVERFGPTGQGALLAFVNDSGPGATAPVVIERPGSDTDEGATGTFTLKPSTRLASGDYSGTVTLTLTAGA